MIRLYRFITSDGRFFPKVVTPLGLQEPETGDLTGVAQATYNLVTSANGTKYGYLLDMETIRGIDGVEVYDNRPTWAISREDPAMNSIIKADNENHFRYHKPHGDQATRYEKIRAAGKVLADVMAECCPDSRELSVAVRRVREAVMYANAAIACNEGDLEP